MATKKKRAKKTSVYERANKALPFELKEMFSNYTGEEKKFFTSFTNTLLRNNVSVVYVTYELEQINNCSFEKVEFGNTAIDLTADRDLANPKIFKTQGEKEYACIAVNGALKVLVYANGNMGDGWKLSIKVNTRNLTATPIERYVGDNGRADHDKVHPLP
jgi:hypothetical protein